MSERDLEARLDAVERALTDDGTDLTDLRETADAVGKATGLESRVAELEARVDELEAGLQAVRGYAGNVRAVNREVERRASAALAKAETLEAAVEDDAPVEAAVPAREAESRTRQGPVESNTSAAQAPTCSADPDGSNAEPRPEAAHSVTGGPQSATGANPSRAESGPRDGSEPQSGQQVGEQRRDRRVRGRSRSGGDDAGSGEPGSDEPGPAEAESQTEQFIERVRDAL